MVITLGGSYNVTQLIIFNYNQSGCRPDRGIYSCNINVSSTSATGPWTNAVNGTVIGQPTGNVGLAGTVVPLPSDPVASYVQIYVNSSYGSSGQSASGCDAAGAWYTGLSQVQVYQGGVAPSTNSYAINAYVGSARRVSNTSGTLLFLDYGTVTNQVADMTTGLVGTNTRPAVMPTALPPDTPRSIRDPAAAATMASSMLASWMAMRTH